jgi:hypothetical protein
MSNKITKFIKKNDLTFEVGERNTNITVLCGYALSQELGMEDIKTAILETSPHTATDCFGEVERVFEYAENNNYGAWWKTQTEWSL